MPDLRALERRIDRFSAQAEGLHAEHGRIRGSLATVQDFLVLAPKARDVLEELSRALFGKILDEVEANLTHAIREILGQDRVVTTQREVKNNRLQIHFQIQNQGNEDEIEDIMTGQGGSVCNILSVGLRLIALSQLPEQNHRPFLVLDEQDCWLKPALIPKFMHLINEIADRLNLQLLVISHHPLDLFAGAADRIYELKPDREHGAVVRKVK
jgi:DNA repair exonuclease SbcCD ATPase subunit